MHRALSAIHRKRDVHALSCVVPFTAALIMRFAGELTKIIICCEICVLLAASCGRCVSESVRSFNRKGLHCMRPTHIQG